MWWDTISLSAVVLTQTHVWVCNTEVLARYETHHVQVEHVALNKGRAGVQNSLNSNSTRHGKIACFSSISFSSSLQKKGSIIFTSSILQIPSSQIFEVGQKVGLGRCVGQGRLLGTNTMMSARLLTPLAVLLRRASSTMVAPRFIPSRLYNIEEIEDYQPGGYHPISIGDTFDQGRYRILHKLGFGGSSTVWLARDQREGKDCGKIVTLKAMRADISSQSPGEIPELAISQTLIESLPPSHSADFQPVDHHFLVQGPNGSHRFLIYPLAGPSILAMSDSPGRVAGSRRLRADLARKVAKQTATTLHHMHSAGVVHGGKVFPPDISIAEK